MEPGVAFLLLVLGVLVVAPLVLAVVFALVGQAREQRHIADLNSREAALAHVVVTDLRSPGDSARSGALVAGAAVIASDWGKQFVAQFRKLIGGEIRSYQSLLSRARREARLRMIEEALALGSTEVHNVRYETSTIGAQSSANSGMAITEILCYGTAVTR